MDSAVKNAQLRAQDTVREYLKKALEYARSNVSPAAVCGYLSWALR